MPKEARKYLFFATIFLSISLHALSTSHSLAEFLNQLPVKDIKALENESFYSGIYEIQFKQPIDHQDTTKGYFYQKLYISHFDKAAPVVLVTEGYSANYYYTSEPASILKCNQIIAEHRFFGESVPDSLRWNFLNTWQAASDHHRIIQTFKEFYDDKWVTTGISKGGKAAIFHSYYYPNDVDLRIPYVAPVNNSIEDFRIYDFLESVGSKNCRMKIKRFQEMALRRQEELIPVFKRFIERENHTFELVGGIEKAFEYCVLEYSFAFWQWGYASCQEIPGPNTSPDQIISHMNSVAGFDYFSDQFIEEYRPFFYQAYTEMGYYGYKLDDFHELLRHVDDGRFLYTLPDKAKVEFNDWVSINVTQYLKSKAENFIFIYGEYDTWSATAIDLSNNNRSKVFYKPEGSHRTRIRNMTEKQQDEIKDLMNSYLNN